jgi:hypothetical protein
MKVNRTLVILHFFVYYACFFKAIRKINPTTVLVTVVFFLRSVFVEIYSKIYKGDNLGRGILSSIFYSNGKQSSTVLVNAKN